ncbi:MAG: VOC family protein [Mastigocoleus sp. MO_167.B18]|uniref:VOC family protein n=1 Tax=Mastigocoleus sp. MO_188.B34 TaxID=3036635 RepID=UPI00260AC7ED|nr:VOC family protein [Mastigocoleus sp. MO_188.B34]MDJ0696003.1 VOC family protein [Mastigocoleus sp. MO_188.B34]MDJ0775480.1 VOC family protein [Mastigocoleus sp. MO_167.B18]
MSIVKGLTKAILYVKDIEKQTEFYRDLLGLKIKSRQSIKGNPEKQWVEFATGECTLVLHGNLNKKLGQDRPKLAFHVDNFEIAYQLLSERGVKFDTIRHPSHGLTIAEAIDPEGNPFTIDCQQ